MIVDIILIAILALFVFIGWKSGLVLSVFLLASTIIAIFLASVLSPVVSDGLEKIGVAEKMAPTFSEHVEEAMLSEYEETGKTYVNKATEKLPLPGFIKEKLALNVETVSAEEISKVSDEIGLTAAKLVCTLLAFVIVFILVLVIMMVVKRVLKIVVKIPLVKQADKIGGLLIGFVQGALFVLVVLLVISVLASTSSMHGVVEAIESSTITKFIYESNFIGKIISKLL